MLSNSFKWKHFVGEIILLNVRWYLKYPLSYRNLKEMMTERGIQVDHSTIMRWVHQYSPEIEKKVRRYLRPTNDSWRIDETYIKVKGEYKYLYRAVDSDGNTIDFHLDSVKDFELLISISTEKIKPKCLALKLKSISDSSFIFDE